MRAPENGTDELRRLREYLPDLEPSEGRSGLVQAGYQLLALVVTIGISIVGGLVTGKLVTS